MADPPFIVAEMSLLSASGPSLNSGPFGVLNSIRYRDIFRRMRYLHVSPHTSGYRCDTLMYPGLLYHMIWDTWYNITIYRDISCDITPVTPNHRARQLQRKRTTLLRPTFCFGSLSLPSSCFVSRLAFFVVLLLPIRWTHRRTDRTTTKHQPCPLMTRPAT